jgi:hypothetical protein
MNDANMTYQGAEALAKDWIEAWNSHDLDRILSHYSQDVIFEAQTARARWNRPDGRLYGTAELRKHFARGLELAPRLKFQFEQVFLAPCGYAVLYRRDNGNRVLDCVTPDSDGRARQVIAYYASAQI